MTTPHRHHLDPPPRTASDRLRELERENVRLWLARKLIDHDIAKREETRKR